MKRKMKIKRRIRSLLLVFSMLSGIMLSSEKIYAASPYTWAGTPTISLSNNSYYKISDMTTYGKNYSTLFSNVNYNNYYTAVTTRVTYFKKVAVSAGQQLRFITADGDIASGSINTSSSRNVMYSLTEFDSNGNPLYETNWMTLNSTWVAGKTSNGLVIEGARSRSNVAYIVFIFKWNDGYTEAGAGSGSNITASQVMTDVKNLYIAKGTTLNYTLSYNGNGGSVSPISKTITYGSTYGSLPTPTRTGYTFKGWYTASSGGSKITSSTAMNRASNHTLYAQWTANKYTVTYDSNGGSTPNTTENYYYSNNVDLSPIAEKRGEIFVGWNTDPNATKALDSYTLPDRSVTLYAIYTIPVSDVANHAYPDYEKIKEEEVYFRIWEIDSEGNANKDNIRTYQLDYTMDTNTMRYRYVLPTTDISDFTSVFPSYGYEVVAFDNAGNYSSLYKSNHIPPPPLVKYWQTVKHYKYDQHLKTWIKFHETTENVLEGITYTPAYATPPAGYKTSHIDGEYVVSGPTTSNAYYVPQDYTITFDANSGTCDVTEKAITFNDYYGTMPIPSKEGHEFIGWYTEKDGGLEVKSSHKYLTPDDTTVYAHWKVLPYQVKYDCRINGGSSADKLSEQIEYGQPIDLDVKAYKEGWDFVGWNTDEKATTGLDSMTMPAHEVTLYAIYKKNITLTIVNQTNDGQNTYSETKTIYNTDRQAVFPIKMPEDWTGWTFQGYTDGTQAVDFPIIGIGNDYKLSESGKLYALYTSEVSLSYDTNGSSMEIDVSLKDCYFNASGDAEYPEYVIAEEPMLLEHTFVIWNIESGTVCDKSGEVLTTCKPGQTVTVSSDTVLKSIWDKHPKLEAYDRYFTLEEAQAGAITQKELLKKVKTTDLEDGTLVNGVDVIVKDYKAVEFTLLEADKDIEVTYQATDSLGNSIEKTIKVHVVDTSMRESKRHRYVRFISPEFFKDEYGNLVPEEKGGLEETSVWRMDEQRRSLLERVLEEVKKKS